MNMVATKGPLPPEAESQEIGPPPQLLAEIERRVREDGKPRKPVWVPPRDDRPGRWLIIYDVRADESGKDPRWPQGSVHNPISPAPVLEAPWAEKLRRRNTEQ